MLKEGVSVLFLRRLFDIFSQGEDLERCGGVSWGDLLENPDDLSDCELETRTDVSAVLDVNVVPASLSSLVTECYKDVSMDSGWEFVDPQSFFFFQKAFDCEGRESKKKTRRKTSCFKSSSKEKVMS